MKRIGPPGKGGPGKCELNAAEQKQICTRPGSNATKIFPRYLCAPLARPARSPITLPSLLYKGRDYE